MCLLDNVISVLEDGLGITVTHALWSGLVMTVTPVPLTLDLPDNVTPVLMDGFLRPVIISVTDSAAVTTTTVRVVSRMEDGKDQHHGRILKSTLHSVEVNALRWSQVSSNTI